VLPPVAGDLGENMGGRTEAVQANFFGGFHQPVGAITYQPGA